MRRKREIPNLAPNTIRTFIRDLIDRGMKFTCHDESQLRPWAHASARKLRLETAGVFFADRSQFSETFSICPTLPSGLSGKKSIPVPAPTRFNSGAL
ncbi:hypothetical protein HN011_007369 [Eciton burchellii]|nr:hypothetical protein HN011_007369 [Eciton burchellii]